MKRIHQSGLIWITGYSASGKTTVARELVRNLRDEYSNVIHFDGDDLRGIFGNSWGYEMNDRVALAKVYFTLCNFIISQGSLVVISAIGKFNATEDWIKDNIPFSLIVELEVSEEERILRDSLTKKIYKKGEVFDSQYDDLKKVDLVIDNSTKNTVSDVASSIYQKLVKKTLNFNDHGRSDHWKNYYSSNEAPSNPSSFAEIVMEKEGSGKNLLEIGCGNGRDTFYFARNDMNVTGIDYSSEAIESCKKQRDSDSINFFSGTIDSISELRSSSFNIAYSRFVLHAMPLAEEKVVLKECYELLAENGVFYIECRSNKSERFRQGDVISSDERSDGHYRRFIDFFDLQSRLIDCGFTIIDAIESDGLAVYKGDDPVLIRIIAKK
jgi:adenylylsulfate kinase-like enzyme